MSTDDAFRGTVDRLAVALNAFVNGDAEPYKSCWSRASTVSIFGGWGAYERGWDQVGPRLEWAAARFVSGRVNQEVLELGSGDDFGYAVTLERGEVTVSEQQRPAPMLLRVTHVFEREADRWVIVHRHADPISEITTPAAVLSV